MRLFIQYKKVERLIWSTVIMVFLLSIFTVTVNSCSSDEKVLYLGLMVHLEGWDEEVNNEDMFIHHADAARELATIFEEYGAKATFEARPEFVAGCSNWNDNVLLELYNRGHGIGVHADVGGGKETLTQRGFAEEIAKMKREMEELTGVEILHVSGICSELDWVRAAIDARYKFVTGIIGYCAMSMPEERRPEEYRDCPTPGKCHGVIPVKLENGINPWRTSTGENWLEDDPDGKLVILTESGVVENLAEYARGEGSIGGEFTQADIDVYIDMLEEALTYTRTGETSILYVALSIGSPDIDEVLYKKWLAAIQTYVDSGRVEWKTLPEMYSIFVEDE
jgi:hypothetical protein